MKWILVALFLTTSCMSNTYRDQWLVSRQAPRIKRINQTITIPAFSAPCGETLRSYESRTAGLPAYQSAVTMTDFTNVVCMQVAVKITSPLAVGEGVLFERTSSVPVFIQYGMYASDGLTFKARFRKGGVIQTFTSPVPIPYNEWCKLTVNWDGTTVKMYINETQVHSGALAAPIDACPVAPNVPLHSMLSVVGFIDEVQVWNEDRSVQDKIKNTLLAPRNAVAGDGVDDGLKAYYKFQGTTTANQVESISGASVYAADGFIAEEGFPYRYGASFICNRFTCAADQHSSLVFPVTKPEDVDFMLCVSWTGADGNTRRYRLWDMDGVDINPMPEQYAGQTLGETFYLEVWNIDGNEFATLSEAITLRSSVTSKPTTSNDREAVSLLTPTQSSALAASFPLVTNDSYTEQQVYP